MFLVDLVPTLILTHDVPDLSKHVPTLFVFMKTLDNDPVWHDPLYEKYCQLLDRNPAMIGVLASAIFVVIHELFSQLTQRQRFQTGSAQSHHDTSGAVFFVYQFIIPFLDYSDLYKRLLQGGLTRTGCELLSAVARGARDVVFPAAQTTRNKEKALGLGISALEILGRFIIIMRLESEGRARVELALYYDVLSQMREFDCLLRELGSKNRNQKALLSEFELQMKHQDDIIQVVKPFWFSMTCWRWYRARFCIHHALGIHQCGRHSPERSKAWKATGLFLTRCIGRAVKHKTYAGPHAATFYTHS